MILTRVVHVRSDLVIRFDVIFCFICFDSNRLDFKYRVNPYVSMCWDRNYNIIRTLKKLNHYFYLITFFPDVRIKTLVHESKRSLKVPFYEFDHGKYWYKSIWILWLFASAVSDVLISFWDVVFIPRANSMFCRKEKLNRFVKMSNQSRPFLTFTLLLFTRRRLGLKFTQHGTILNTIINMVLTYLLIEILCSKNIYKYRLTRD